MSCDGPYPRDKSRHYCCGPPIGFEFETTWPQNGNLRNGGEMNTNFPPRLATSSFTTTPISILDTSHKNRRQINPSRALQTSKIRTIFLIDISWSRSRVVFDQDHRVEISCKDTAHQIVFLEQESLDMAVCARKESSTTTLICDNVLRDPGGEASLFSEQLSTNIVVACLGDAFEDVDTVTATMLETVIDMDDATSIYTQFIQISIACSPLHSDGSVRDSRYGLNINAAGTHQCTGTNTSGIDSFCDFAISCLEFLDGALFGSCPQVISPAVSATATAHEEFALSVCYYTNETPDFPALDTNPTTIQYRAILSYQESGCVTSGVHSVTVQCENGGKLDQLSESDGTCTRVDDRTIECSVPANVGNADLLSGSTDFSCTGTDLTQLSLTLTWNPGPLSCLESSTGGNILRVLELYQLCPPASLTNVLGPYADNVAVTCYPTAGTFQEVITSEEGFDTNNDGIIDESGDAFSLSMKACSTSVGYGCSGDSCGVDFVPRMIATILPQHFSLDPLCFAGDDEAGFGEEETNDGDGLVNNNPNGGDGDATGDGVGNNNPGDDEAAFAEGGTNDEEDGSGHSNPNGADDDHGVANDNPAGDEGPSDSDTLNAASAAGSITASVIGVMSVLFLLWAPTARLLV